MSKGFIRTFFRDSAIYTIPTIVTNSINIFLVPLYTRVLSPTDYGAIDMLRMFGSIAGLTVAFEVYQGLVIYFTSEKTADGRVTYASTALWFSIFCYSLFSLICLAFAPFLSNLIIGTPGFVLLFRIGVIQISMNGLFLLINNQFRWELRSKEYVTNSLITFFITAIFSVLLAYVFKFGVYGMIIALLISNTVGCLYGLLMLRSTFSFKFDFSKLKEMLSFSAPLVPSGIMVFLSGYIDRIMINHFLTLNEVGLYGVGFRVASISIIVLAGFQASLTPLIYTYHKESKTPNQIATIFRIFTMVSLLIFLLLTSFAPEILWLLTTPNFYPAYQVVVFMVPSILLSQIYIFLPGIAIEKKTRLILYTNLANAILNTILNYFLIPIFGFKGAAIATFISYFVMFIVNVKLSQKYYFIPFEWTKIIICTVFAIGIYWICTYLHFEFFINILIKCIILFSIFPIFYFSKLIKKEELTLIIQKVRSFF